VDLVFFILGHIAFFSASASTCTRSSPVLYRFALLSLVSGYLGFVVPFLIAVFYSYRYRAVLLRPRHAQQQRQRAATKAELAACRQTVWSDTAAAAAAGQDEEESCGVVCSVCYVEFEGCEEVTVLPCNDKHVFHSACIRPWLDMRDSCPLCKTRLKTALSGFKKAARSPAGGSRRPAAGGSSGSNVLTDIAPYLPGTVAASLSLSAYAGGMDIRPEEQEEESCPTPTPPMQEEEKSAELRLEVRAEQQRQQQQAGGDAVVDVTQADAGVGLGLPALPRVSSARSVAVAAAIARMRATRESETNLHLSAAAQ
jgi:hypothetical protein